MLSVDGSETDAVRAVREITTSAIIALGIISVRGIAERVSRIASALLTGDILSATERQTPAVDVTVLDRRFTTSSTVTAASSAAAVDDLGNVTRGGPYASSAERLYGPAVCRWRGQRGTLLG